MSIVSEGPPLQGLLEINGRCFQTAVKPNVEIEWFTVLTYYWEIKGAHFYINTQRWGGDIDKLNKYFDFLPFEGNEPPILYTTPRSKPNGYKLPYSFDITKECADLMGIQQDEYREIYNFTIKSTTPYVFGSIHQQPNIQQYAWYVPIGENWRILNDGYVYNCSTQRCYSMYMLGLPSNYVQSDENYAIVKSIPWLELFDIQRREDDV